MHDVHNLEACLANTLSNLEKTALPAANKKAIRDFVDDGPTAASILRATSGASSFAIFSKSWAMAIQEHSIRCQSGNRKHNWGKRRMSGRDG
jgi:hypothetical protein